MEGVAIPLVETPGTPATPAIGSVAAPGSGGSSFRRQAPAQQRMGVFFPLFLLWLVFEFGRPPLMLGIPMAISVTLFIGWITGRRFQWNRFTVCWFVLLGVMALGVPFAESGPAALWTTRLMAVLFLCICLPLQALLNSVGRVRLFILTLVAISAYVGAWATQHAGYGPSGAAGAQDENYVAALMGMATPLAYFALLAERRLLPRLLLGAAIAVSISAVALGANPSRGGFIGLCVAGLYCASRSPKKKLGFGLLGLMTGILLAVAGPAFWAEMETTTEIEGGTGDIRIELWKMGFRMWQAYPVFGVGPDNFRFVVGNFQSAEQFAKFGRSLGNTVPHSLHVELVTELGIVGAIAMAVLVWSTWTGLGKLRDRIATDRNAAHSHEMSSLMYYSDGIRGGILAILVNGVFLSLLYFSHIWLLLAAGSALPFVYLRASQRWGVGTAAPVKPSVLSRARAGQPQAASDSGRPERSQRGGRA